MLMVQQAVFTVESLIGKVQQQKQLIHQLVQENEHLRHENKQLRKENEQLKYRVQELEARTKKTAPIAICPHLLTVLPTHVLPVNHLATSQADKKDIKERRSIK
ncbi:Mobile element protein [Geobacillus stearothermophilus]|uniref:Mobile element protein n=1 Tax=Geobacillus stearothermophilus TaxID=1422 RepID=A0ABQ7HBF9_GEOSE|nr:Mobile element protein [Geobacillus stearothermophilus]